MKSVLKSWLATNLLEMSTWIGFIIVLRELLASNASTLMLVLGAVLVFVSDAKLNAFIQKYTPGLKKWIESL